MADAVTNRRDWSLRERSIRIACVFAILMATRALGEHAWWATPMLIFAAGLALAIRHQDPSPITVRAVLLAAAIAVACGAVLTAL